MIKKYNTHTNINKTSNSQITLKKIKDINMILLKLEKRINSTTGKLLKFEINYAKGLTGYKLADINILNDYLKEQIQLSLWKRDTNLTSANIKKLKKYSISIKNMIANADTNYSKFLNKKKFLLKKYLKKNILNKKQIQFSKKVKILKPLQACNQLIDTWYIKNKKTATISNKLKHNLIIKNNTLLKSLLFHI